MSFHGYPGGWEELREDEEAEDAAAEEREREAEEDQDRKERERMDAFDRSHDAYLGDLWEEHEAALAENGDAVPGGLGDRRPGA